MKCWSECSPVYCLADLEATQYRVAMAIHNDKVFVFAGDKIKVYRIVDTALHFKLEITRKYEGFVQSCRIINGRLYACNWGLGRLTDSIL
ncbi:hypothetical protein [Paenibacillus sp. MBLB4367]|uniref:hypothetical protein n=1 Tax=Paenibacillus sp. MBLB4367 TaxID=3384767 RepID=UPI003907F675